ncbi:hypothetical protein COV15_02635 [Candidatus Woesearchaeota archaeon CG10_big_fil_rev_8_21_14_0_10_34_12]|nr:MAG: hypothetical protein COV15_02635 [Candidatus Woesearchaeota archaeon CG10_big_fil_rev_8_21_14_0_10_34_12]
MVGESEMSHVREMILVILVVVVLAIAAIYFFSPIKTYFGNLFSYNNTGGGTLPIPDGAVKSNLIPDRCYERYPECRVCVMDWVGNLESFPSVGEISSGGEAYVYVRGTGGCKGENVFLSVWKDNWVVDGLESEKKAVFSDEDFPMAYFKVKLNKGEYYFYVFKSDASKEQIKTIRRGNFENWVFKQTGVENIIEAKSVNLKVI